MDRNQIIDLVEGRGPSQFAKGKGNVVDIRSYMPASSVNYGAIAIGVVAVGIGFLIWRRF